MLPVILLFVWSCGGAPPETEQPGAPALEPVDREAAARGRETYATYCALCHGATGEGYIADNAPALANTDFLAAASDAYLTRAIEEGRPGTPMSAWSAGRGGPLSPEQVHDLVVFLRSWSTEPPIDLANVMVHGRREIGANLYGSRCAVCHGANGEGVTAPALSNPVFTASATPGFIRYTIEHGRRGTPMIGYGDQLDSASIDDLVAFVVGFVPRAATPTVPMGGPPPDLEHLVMNPSGPAPQFELREERFLPGSQVHTAMEAGARMVILDARAASDWAATHIRGAAPFPFYSVDELASHLPNDDTWIIAYCACPHAASGHVVDELRTRGFTHTAILDEGIPWWIEQHYPIEAGPLP
jgi:cytochrome c oxidase cbb3-type subunit 3/ubiquinol-cytochrome c reductase cytochrome c subunit